jgi:hypothetical protein
VEKRRREQIAVVVSGAEQPVRHVESVTPIGDRHGLIQRQRAIRQEAPSDHLLSGVDPRSNVRHRLHDPMHR